MPLLGKVAPTEQAVVAARKQISAMSPTELKNKMSSMTNWLKGNPEDASLVDGARGEKRKMYLAAYLGVVVKEKEAQRKLKLARTITAKRSFERRIYWWSKFEMEKNLGPEKSKAWIDSKNIGWRADPITGSEDENLREYAIPREFKTMSWEDFLKLSIIRIGGFFGFC